MLFIFYLEQLCPICITSPKNMAFGCGHQVFNQYCLDLVMILTSSIYIIDPFILFRHAVIVESFWMLAQFVDVLLRPE